MPCRQSPVNRYNSDTGAIKAMFCITTAAMAETMSLAPLSDNANVSLK